MTLVAQLWRLSEAGEPAYLLGRPTEPTDAALFEQLVTRGVLRHAGRQTTWDVCDDCDCGRDDRLVREIGGVPVAVCVMDRNRDQVLKPDDLLTFELSIPDLVVIAAKSSGLTLPPEQVSRGIWKLGRATSDTVVFVVPTRRAIIQTDLAAVLRYTEPSQAVLLLGPAIGDRQRADLSNCGIHHETLCGRTGVSASSPLLLNLALPTAGAPPKPRLRLHVTSLTVALDGRSVQLPKRRFDLLLLLARRAASWSAFPGCC